MLSEKNKMKQGSPTEFFRRFFPEGKGNRAIFIAGVLLLCLIAFFYTSAKTPAKEVKPLSSSESYVAETEARLEALLSGVSGVGECSVMITLQSGVEYVYAEEEKYSSDVSSSDSRTETGENRQKSYVTTRTSGEEAPVIITEISPAIRGVAVICDGGGNTAVKAVITEIVGKALGISGDKIAIAKANP